MDKNAGEAQKKKKNGGGYKARELIFTNASYGSPPLQTDPVQDQPLHFQVPETEQQRSMSVLFNIVPLEASYHIHVHTHKTIINSAI